MQQIAGEKGSMGSQDQWDQEVNTHQGDHVVGDDASKQSLHRVFLREEGASLVRIKHGIVGSSHSQSLVRIKPGSSRRPQSLIYLYIRLKTLFAFKS